ncbi:hypothetical protein L1887_40522 [Cichorium endivia]|nr:hypothetical protein L1887_40522 [Cichorium endivia]
MMRQKKSAMSNAMLDAMMFWERNTRQMIRSYDGGNEAVERDGKRPEQAVKVLEHGLEAGRVSGARVRDGFRGLGEREMLCLALVLFLLGTDLGGGSLGDGGVRMAFEKVRWRGDAQDRCRWLAVVEAATRLGRQPCEDPEV